MRGAYGRGGRGSGDAVHDQRCRIQRGEVAVASFNFTPPAVSVETVPMIEAVVPSGFGEGPKCHACARRSGAAAFDN